jgi:hypothetical protein
MTLATICRSVATRVGVAQLPAWAGSTDDTAREVLEFVQEAHDMVVQAFDWQVLIRPYQVNLAAGPVQTLALPTDFGRLIPGTMWISGQSCPVRGPVTEVEFERLTRPIPIGTTPVFRLASGVLELLASPVGAGLLSFRYLTGMPLVSAAGVPQREWQADTDASLLNERLVILGAVMLWRDSKGLQTQGAAAQYMFALSRAKATDRPIGVMSMGGSMSGNSPVARPDGAVLLWP